MEHARPFMQQLRDNNRQAMERALAVLTPDQQERARAMMPQRRGPGGPPPQPRQPARLQNNMKSLFLYYLERPWRVERGRHIDSSHTKLQLGKVPLHVQTSHQFT
jgi:hypothetical protein